MNTYILTGHFWKQAVQICCLALVTGACMCANALAQLNPLSAQYYQNQYLGNPAFAGINEGLMVNMDYRNQWRVIPGSPVTQSVTADYRFRKVGTGLNIYSDKAGLITRHRVVGSYAYHLPLDGEEKELHFGLSLGIMKAKLDNTSIVGDPADDLASRFNNRKVYLDGDFGIAYMNKRFTAQGALPNLKNLLKKDETTSVDGSTYFLAMSYKLGVNPEVISAEPKLSFRGARGMDQLWDFGADLKFLDNMISIMGVYHSSRSSTIGLGLNYQNKAYIQGYYTSQISTERLETGGDFEISLRVPLMQNKRMKDPSPR